ncbi:DNA mismatch repair endonuclease MutL [Planctomycetales bacterium ZRK34]|nr:DNA mismatch repair endonuclease MutL [Planctomycetales bacterium ZRK34]
MPIAKLSPLLVNQIAAGEVIERPASVVKELVDNALDAGATRIDVQIAEGGRDLVRVADDGAGIGLDEMELALTPHATSKIATADDLAAIQTMGFRGEALASIMSVSRMRLASRARGAEAGGVIEASGDRIGSLAPIGSAVGTVVEVRNLFFNTPARRKFMRGASTEFGHINDMLRRLAMAHPSVGFKLTHQTRVTFDLPPGQTPAQRCMALLGDDVAEAMLEFDSDERGIKLWGMAGLPSLARATAKYQYVYVNGRPVRDRNIMHAIKEAYRGLIEPSAQPMIVLFVTMQPREVDVNVHPTKSEVRFADANAVHGQVLATVRQRLLATDLVPQARLAGGFKSSFSASSVDLTAAGEQPQPQIESTRDFVDYFKRMDPTQKGFIYQQVKQEMADDREDDQADEQRDDEPALTESIRPSAQSILQVHNSYIVTQDEHGIVIIDQHALHERMMFETLYDRICKHGALESQRLITPVIIDATAGRIATLEQVQPLLAKIGIEAEAMGPNTIGVHAFATLLFDRGVDPVEFIEALLDRAEEQQYSPSDEAALHEVLDMMSCKAAVKAGDSLRPEELGELLARRDQIERASNCPHGRPTTVRLSLRDLEKHFKRS